MSDEIERKFLIKKMPDLSNFKSIKYERYYIFKTDKIELRVQSKEGKFELERKEIVSKLKSIKTKLEISKEEFEKLKSLSSQVILRESYILSVNPEISIKRYQGKHEGLKKIEVEFKSEEEANLFQPEFWYGKEITNSIVSRDSKLLDLTDKEFKDFLKNN